MKPHAMDAETGNLTLIMQAYLVRTRHHTILMVSKALPVLQHSWPECFRTGRAQQPPTRHRLGMSCAA